MITSRPRHSAIRHRDVCTKQPFFRSRAIGTVRKNRNDYDDDSSSSSVDSQLYIK